MTALIRARRRRAAAAVAMAAAAAFLAAALPQEAAAEQAPGRETTRSKTSAAPLPVKNTRSVYVCSPAGFGQKSRCYRKG